MIAWFSKDILRLCHDYYALFVQLLNILLANNLIGPADSLRKVINRAKLNAFIKLYSLMNAHFLLNYKYIDTIASGLTVPEGQ